MHLLTPLQSGNLTMKATNQRPYITHVVLASLKSQWSINKQNFVFIHTLHTVSTDMFLNNKQISYYLHVFGFSVA